ncbi:phosphatidate cytidylyltransferase [Vibrio sp. HN007]|uniref:phosphatidate cytidylyltransferase n=1 Tax=Vibrio iocasae TaxID=3098914 RepID=UPI0035D45E15
MKQRIITALILAPLAVLAIFELSLPFFILALAAVTIIGFWEWGQFIGSKSRYLAMIPTLLAFAASYIVIPSDVMSMNIVTTEHLFMLVLASIWWILASALTITYPRSTITWEGSKMSRQIFGMLTLIPFFWSVVLLRAQDVHANPYYGAKLVMFVCLIVWAADSGAYFAGKSFGKHKMAPKVSPNKTIEGLIGGIITAFLVGWGANHFFELSFSGTGAMMITMAITVVISVLGDLVESMFKRVSGIKDSSNIIPGHGGMLDRIDSLTAAFPVFTLLYFTL